MAATVVGGGSLTQEKSASRCKLSLSSQYQEVLKLRC